MARIARPLLDRPIPVARPRLPLANAVLPYLRQIDRAGWYSNHGPLSEALQLRLATLWGVAPQEVALLSNATSALTLSLLASGVRRGQRCLMPSWTFAASAGAVVAAGMVPHFVDVLPGTWAPDPAQVQELAMDYDVGAVLVVAPFGAPLDMAAWNAVRTATGLPVVIDGAAAFDTLRAGGPMQPGACPVAVSLHATKVFGVGEGGALICRDPAIMDRVRRLAQFGFLGSRESQLPGMNAKLSEYAAAVGMAGLDEWPEARTRWHVAASRYRQRLAAPLLSPGFGAGWVSSTLTVLGLAGHAATSEIMARHGVATLRWWGPGCHAQPSYHHCSAEPLPVTEGLAARAIGLPFWQDLTEAQIDQVCAAVSECCEKVPEARVAA